MQPVPYLYFKDNCAEAFGYYADVFNTDPPDLLAAQDHVPDAPKGAIMHAAIKIGDGWLFGHDDFSGGDYRPMAGVSLLLSLPDKAETTRVFEALSDGGEVHQPLIETFFTPAFGLCSDRFGIRWMVMTDSPQES